MSLIQIERLLKKSGLSQRWLANKLKRSQSTVSRWVRQKNVPSPGDLFLMQSILKKQLEKNDANKRSKLAR